MQLRSSLALPPPPFSSYIFQINFAVVGTLPARGTVDCELLTLSWRCNSCVRSTVPPRVMAPVPFLSTSTSCAPPRASDTVACHARRERESAEVAKAAAQLLSREPRVFIRPNVRGTLVAIEKAASHSVSLFTIIMWGARSRFERIWLSYWIHSSLRFHFASSITIITIITSTLFTLKSGPPPHPIL